MWSFVDELIVIVVAIDFILFDGEFTVDAIAIIIGSLVVFSLLLLIFFAGCGLVQLVLRSREL